MLKQIITNLAIVIPCYNEEEIVKTTFEKISEIITNLKNSDFLYRETYKKVWKNKRL